MFIESYYEIETSVSTIAHDTVAFTFAYKVTRRAIAYCCDAKKQQLLKTERTKLAHQDLVLAAIKADHLP